MSNEDDRMAVYLRYFPPVEAGGSYGAGDYMHMFGTPLGALLYSELYAPEVLRIGDCLFFEHYVARREQLTAAVEAAKSPLELSAIECSWNNIWLPNCFSDFDLEYADDTEVLAKHLIRAWRGWLKGHYPDRDFAFATYPWDIGSGVEDITWWTDRGHSAEELDSVDVSALTT